MRNLLSANFVRLFKCRALVSAALVLLAISVSYIINVTVQAKTQLALGYPCNLELYYFQMAPFIGLFCASFVSLFIGTEYSDGGLRNKLAVGHSRAKVYLSNYVSALAGCELLTLVWLLSGLLAVPVLGFLKMEPAALAVYLGVIVLYTAALTGIFVMVSMLSSNKAVNAVLVIMLAFAMMIAAFLIFNRLCEPEMVSGYVLTADGVQEGEPKVNPAYISGTVRQVYQFLTDCLPGGQAIEIADLMLARPLLSAVSSVVLTAVTLFAGCALFERKDLK